MDIRPRWTLRAFSPSVRTAARPDLTSPLKAGGSPGECFVPDFVVHGAGAQPPGPHPSPAWTPRPEGAVRRERAGTFYTLKRDPSRALLAAVSPRGRAGPCDCSGQPGTNDPCHGIPTGFGSVPRII